MHLDWLTKELLSWSFLAFATCTFAGCNCLQESRGELCVLLNLSVSDFLEQINLVVGRELQFFFIFLKLVLAEIFAWSRYCLRNPSKSARGCSGWWPWWEMPDQCRRLCCPLHAWMRWEVLKCPAKRNWDCIRRCCLLALVGDTCFWGGRLWAEKGNSMFVDVRAGRSQALFAKSW